MRRAPLLTSLFLILPFCLSCGAYSPTDNDTPYILETRCPREEVAVESDPTMAAAFVSYMQQIHSLAAPPKIIEDYGKIGNAYVARFAISSKEHATLTRDTIRGTRFVNGPDYLPIMVYDGRYSYNLKGAYQQLILSYADLRKIDSLQNKVNPNYATLYETAYPIDVDRGYAEFCRSGKEFSNDRPLFLEKKVVWDGNPEKGYGVRIEIDGSFNVHEFTAKDFAFNIESITCLTPFPTDGDAKAKQGLSPMPGSDSFHPVYKVMLKSKNDFTPFIRYAETLDFVRRASPAVI